jgi:hypothetical protein
MLMAARQREMQKIEVKMNDIEFRREAEHLLQHDEVMNQGVAVLRIQTQGMRYRWSQPGTSPGVAAGEQGDIVTLTDQFFGQIGNDAFGTTVEFWWNAFDQWGYLGDFHD